MFLVKANTFQNTFNLRFLGWNILRLVISSRAISCRVISGWIISGRVISGWVISGWVISGWIISGWVISGLVISGRVISGGWKVGNNSGWEPDIFILGHFRSGHFRFGHFRFQVVSFLITPFQAGSFQVFCKVLGTRYFYIGAILGMQFQDDHFSIKQIKTLVVDNQNTLHILHKISIECHQNTLPFEIKSLLF